MNLVFLKGREDLHGKDFQMKALSASALDNAPKERSLLGRRALWKVAGLKDRGISPLGVTELP